MKLSWSTFSWNWPSGSGKKNNFKTSSTYFHSFTKNSPWNMVWSFTYLFFLLGFVNKVWLKPAWCFRSRWRCEKFMTTMKIIGNSWIVKAYLNLRLRKTKKIQCLQKDFCTPLGPKYWFCRRHEILNMVSEWYV